MKVRGLHQTYLMHYLRNHLLWAYLTPVGALRG